MTKRHSSLIAALLASVLPAAGCSNFLCTEKPPELACEQPTGDGTVQAGAAVGLPERLAVVMGGCAQSSNGRDCDMAHAFTISASKDLDPHVLTGSIFIQPSGGESSYRSTYPVPDSELSRRDLEARASFLYSDVTGEVQHLRIVSGVVDVKNRTNEGLEASFSFTLETNAGERIVVESDNVVVSGCHLWATCSL